MSLFSPSEFLKQILKNPKGRSLLSMRPNASLSRSISHLLPLQLQRAVSLRPAFATQSLTEVKTVTALSSRALTHGTSKNRSEPTVAKLNKAVLSSFRSHSPFGNSEGPLLP